MENQNIDPKKQLQEPVKLFDDLYYIGNMTVGSWVIKTSAGLVLIDSSSLADEYEQYLVPSLKKLGLENEKILCLLLTHGHFDHCEGAYMIQQRTGCDVALSLEDTAYMAYCYENWEPKNRFQIPQVTMLLKDGQDLVFGDHTIHVMMATGHTPGCLNFSMEVHEGEETHRFVMMGGFGVFGPGRYPDGEYPYGVLEGQRLALAFAYSCVELWEYAKANHADVFLNPHPQLCDVWKLNETNKSRQPGDPNPFVIGLEGVRKWIENRYTDCLESAQKFTDIRQEYHEK